MSETIKIVGPEVEDAAEILTPEALAFVGQLVRRYRPRIAALLNARSTRQAAIDAGAALEFPTETAAIRAGDWRAAPLPKDLLDRRVEITGPVSRKMIINALNSGANVFMADFEDSSSPTWETMVGGQINLRDAVRGTIEFTAAKTGKHYALNDAPAVLMVRPRGLHLSEVHVQVDGEAAPGSLVDFGLYFFHNAKALLAKGSGPYFYLPKLESYREAALWNDVFEDAQAALGIPSGTIKATVLIETLPAAFEMDEIIHALGAHAAGLNCGRWDYIFSFIKTLRADASKVLPERSQVGMTQPFMAAYTRRVVQTCHRRGVHAMGGMAAQIPIKHDPAANEAAMAKVRADKVREAQGGHDGTWVAHPGLVGLARAVFDAEMPGLNQIENPGDPKPVTPEELVAAPSGTRTESGLRTNVRVGIQYLAAWLDGNGCVPIDHLMEDAATAEISRTQLWQWRTHGAKLDDGRTITAELIQTVTNEERAKLDGTPQLQPAAELFERLCTEDTLTEFLTLPAYELLLAGDHNRSNQ